MPIRKDSLASYMAAGRAATVIATCTMIRAVHVRPSCIDGAARGEVLKPGLHPPAGRLQRGQHADDHAGQDGEQRDVDDQRG